jgi:apolipoprotein D and lipocalin family protein
MKNKIKPLILVSLLLSLMIVNGCERREPPKAVAKVDLTRYMGTWYEIASFPNRFQKGCTCSHAHYEKRKDYVRVINRCWRKKRWDTVKGKAYEVKGSEGAKLKVQFFWPFKGDYWVLWLDKDYQQVLVGSPDYKYLWILARNKHLDKKQLAKIKSIAKEKGYDVNKLVLTECHHKSASIRKAMRQKKMLSTNLSVKQD